MIDVRRAGIVAVVAGLVFLAMPGPAAAHCDSMDGPVVQAAVQALATGEVERVLVWVRPEDEEQIRAAFRRTLEVRRLGGEAEELADYWFFETLVRVHRAGEGAPYTGLKPSGTEVGEGIQAAETALEHGSVESLATEAADGLVQALRQRFQEVRSLETYDRADVEAGRRYVHAYVELIHFVEALHGLLHEGAAHHEG